MVKNFRKSFLFVFLLVLSLTLLAGCTPSNQVDPNAITEEKLEALVFEDGVFEYDGKEKKLYVENIYEEQGVTVAYTNNNNVMPGTYTVNAVIKYENFRVTKSATITINKGTSVLEAETEQTVYVTDKNFKVVYKLSNNRQKVQMFNEQGEKVELTDLAQVGVYKLELYAPENNYFKESNHVKVTFNVVKSIFDVQFNSKEVEADGQEHKIELEGTLPAGYTVEYTDNKGTEDGTYYAVAAIKDANGDVVEKHNAVLKIENKENEAFNQYLDEFFVEYLEDDQLSVNIFCEDPSKFGLEHYDAEWYTYETFGDDAIEQDLETFKELLAELEEFKDQPLSDVQEYAYRTIEKFLNYYITFYSVEDAFFTQNLYVDQFGGYVADFGTYMEAYSLRSELEVQDVVKFIESTKTAFPSYLDFLNDKAEKGYALSDYSIEKMQEYLDEIINSVNGYYLKDILNEKIDKLVFLSTEKKEDYKSQIATAIKECFMVGIVELNEGLDQFKGKLAKEDEGYLAAYENGEELYLIELENLLGIKIDKEAYIAEVEAAVTKAVKDVVDTQRVLVNGYQISTWAQLEQLVNKNIIIDGTPEEMMVYLKEFAKTLVPELKSDPVINIKEMDIASASASNAVAYYMKSALDNTAGENITLNPIKLGSSSKNDVLSTLAHEGYPGHLYAYVYSKELGLSNLATVMTSTAHAEGWATYVSTQLYGYAKKSSTSQEFIDVMNYLIANEKSGFLLETRIDAGIHLEGWTVEDIAAYMDKLGYSSDGAQGIYDLIIEMPSQYAAYGYGKMVFTSLHEEAQKILGIYYNEIEFNAMLLSKGWTNLGLLQETYNEYMMAKCHELAIEFK